MENENEHIAINGTVDFTSDGLGITPSNRLDNNICMYGKETTHSLLKMFDDV